MRGRAAESDLQPGQPAERLQAAPAGPGHHHALHLSLAPRPHSHGQAERQTQAAPQEGPVHHGARHRPVGRHQPGGGQRGGGGGEEQRHLRPLGGLGLRPQVDQDLAAGPDERPVPDLAGRQ